MKSRIFVSILSLSVAVLSLSLGGCSGKSNESMGDTSHNNVVSPSGDGSYNSSTSENSVNSVADGISESVQPSGTPTIFIGPDDKPIYSSEITEIINAHNTSLTAETITVDDEGTTILCEGFQYFKEPAGVAYNNYENPELFEKMEFVGKMPGNTNAWKRVNVGDKICGLTLKSATTAFANYNKDSFEYYQTYYTFNVPNFDTYAEFDGSITLTGFLNSSPRTPYEPDGGKLRFTPAEDKLPVMCGFFHKIEPETYMLASSYSSRDLYVFNEINEIAIDNSSELDLDCIGIGDTAFVRVTISDIKYYGYGVDATLTDIEVLSDVLAHDEDTV